VPPFAALWPAMTPQRRVLLIGAGAALIAVLSILSRVATAPQMALLYAGLEPAAAGAVIAALDARGVAHEVRGGAIYADASARDALRMELAAEGLPANGGAGYELLDGLSGFGTTAQMFDAAYWRAKEGELARTITAAPTIRAARVHIANPVARPFAASAAPSASVTVTGAGGPVSPGMADAVRHLVASAVAGLAAADVRVIDTEAGLLRAPDEGAAGAVDADSRAARLKQNAERLLEAHLGPGRAVVEVSVETVTEAETLVERRFDPDGRVAISTDTEERTTAERNAGPEPVTVASNLPDGAGAGGGASSRQDAETRERVNYEVSESQRELHRAPGAVRRLSVAVLIDVPRAAGPDGAPAPRPRSEAELAALAELVRSAVGFDAARGDALTLRELPFEPLAEAGNGPPAPGLIDRLRLDPMLLIQLAVLALVALVLGLFVVRPLLTARPPARRAELAAPPGAPGDPAGAAPGHASMPALGAPLDAPLDASPPEEDPVERLRGLIASRQAETAEILRSWIEAPGGKA
jgi:flagellar M-ring protein FliF